MRPKRYELLGLLLAFTLLALTGCANPLIRAKETFSEGVAGASFDTDLISRLEQYTDSVCEQQDRYGSEGAAQARLMLAYAYLTSGRATHAELLAEDVRRDTDVTELSGATQALLTVVTADARYERALDLAKEDTFGNMPLICSCMESAAQAYQDAWSSEDFASQPALRQLFALREADILISGGNLMRACGEDYASELYTQAVKVATEASELDPALRDELLERADRARSILETME